MMVIYYNTLNKNKSVIPYSYLKEREEGEQGKFSYTKNKKRKKKTTTADK